MTIAHQEQHNLRKHCDGIRRYVSAATAGINVGNGARESHPTRAANVTA